MKVACVLLVHKNPEQVARLIEKLSHPGIDCWVHIDKKFDNTIFRQQLSFPNVFFVQDNVQVDWGCYNTVAAMVICLRNIVNAREDYSYVSFLSGQDYLLKPPNEFINYLRKNNGKEFMSIQKLDASPGYGVRIKKYHLNAYSFPGKKLVQRIINKILPDRKFPKSFEVRKGSQWLTISKDATKYVLAFLDKNAAFKNYFKLVDTPDEFFFQTILYNSNFRDKIQDGVFHYTDWSEHTRHPKLLTMKNRDALWNSYYFFARKFDINIDQQILDLIDSDKLAND
ncbi:MAG: beta-1,6-N-acetylglucosaminyltransferase [Ferruginibacter sp.]